MHKGILAGRRLEAIRAITESLQDLAADPELKERAARLDQITARDSDVRELKILEEVAQILSEMETVEIDAQSFLETIKAEGPELTKTSLQALEAWAKGPEPEED